MLEDYANYSLQEKNQLYKMYDEESWQAGRHTPGSLQMQPCHMPGEIGVQLLGAASYGKIMVQTPITHLASAEQTCGRTDHKGKKYGQHQTQEPTSGTERHNQHCQESFCIVTETMFLIFFFSPWLLYASVCRPLPPSLTTQAICSSRPLCFHVS